MHNKGHFLVSTSVSILSTLWNVELLRDHGLESFSEHLAAHHIQ